MNFDQFKPLALRTESVVDSAKVNWLLFGAVINNAIAAANLLDAMKKNIYYGKPIDEQVFADNARQAQDQIGLILYDSVAGSQSELTKKVIPGNMRVLHAALGKFTEAGELLEAVVPGLNGELIDAVNLAEELGDDAWYTAILVDAAGLNMDNIQETVIAKLQARYPEKFDATAAIERDLDNERAVLEANAETAAAV